MGASLKFSREARHQGGDMAYQESAVLACTKPWVLSSALHKTGMESKAGGSGVQGYPQLCIELEASLGYLPQKQSKNDPITDVVYWEFGGNRGVEEGKDCSRPFYIFKFYMWKHFIYFTHLNF